MLTLQLGKKKELYHKPNIIPRRGRSKKIIQLEDGSDYWEWEKLQPLEKVQEKDIVWNKEGLKEEKKNKEPNVYWTHWENTGYCEGQG